MTEPQHTPVKPAPSLGQAVARRRARKLKARRDGAQGVWSGWDDGTDRLVGGDPTLLARRWASGWTVIIRQHPWTLALLVLGSRSAV